MTTKATIGIARELFDAEGNLDIPGPGLELAALIQNRIVGIVQYVVKGDCIHIIGLGAHPHFRRRDVARAFLGRSSQWVWAVTWTTEQTTAPLPNPAKPASPP